jgi:hypothetical protein
MRLKPPIVGGQTSIVPAPKALYLPSKVLGMAEFQPAGGNA